MVLSLEFSTQHRRLEKLEGKMNELLNQKESLQNDYEALQSTNDMLKGMVEEAKRGRALQVQETIKTEMLMGDAVAALDVDLLETTGRAIQLESENAFLRQQIANLEEALAANERRANDQGTKLNEAESTIATLITEKVVLETDKAGLEVEKTKLWEEAADTFAEGFDLALEADCSQFAIDFEVVAAGSFVLDHCCFDSTSLYITLNVKTFVVYINATFLLLSLMLCISLNFHLLLCMSNC